MILCGLISLALIRTRDILILHVVYGEDELKKVSGLVIASPLFFAYVQQCEETFISMFEKHSHNVGILTLIANELTYFPLPVDCDKFPKMLFLRYFVRIRIYYMLKFTNSKNATAKKSAVRKDKKLAKLKHE